MNQVEKEMNANNNNGKSKSTRKRERGDEPVIPIGKPGRGMTNNTKTKKAKTSSNTGTKKKRVGFGTTRTKEFEFMGMPTNVRNEPVLHWYMTDYTRPKIKTGVRAFMNEKRIQSNVLKYQHEFPGCPVPINPANIPAILKRSQNIQKDQRDIEKKFEDIFPSIGLPDKFYPHTHFYMTQLMTMYADLMYELHYLNLYKLGSKKLSNENRRSIEQALIDFKYETKQMLDMKNSFEKIFHINLPTKMTHRLYRIIQLMLRAYDQMGKERPDTF